MKAIVLLSVGIDSPVAAHLMVKKGVEVIGINFSFKGPDTDILQRLMEKVGIKTTYHMDMGKFHASIQRSERYRCIMCKRYMYKVAERLAKEIGAEAIITGENLGQVASQTLRNMEVIDSSVSLPVLRPLLCYDKTEIIAVARTIETYKISIERNYDCPVLPKSPATSSIASKIEEKEEGKDDFLTQAIKETTQITI